MYLFYFIINILILGDKAKGDSKLTNDNNFYLLIIGYIILFYYHYW